MFFYLGNLNVYEHANHAIESFSRYNILDNNQSLHFVKVIINHH